MLAVRPFVVTAAANKPRRERSSKSRHIAVKLKRAIEHARLICINFEDTKECAIAWDQVEELSAAKHDSDVWPDDRSTREYDL